MISCLRFTASHLFAIVRRPTKLGDALPKRRQKCVYIMLLVEIIVKQREHLILMNQQFEE